MGFFLTVIFPHEDEVSASSVSFRLANKTAFLFVLYVLVKLYQLGPCFTIYCTSHSNDIILLFLILCLKGIETVLGNFIGISFSRTLQTTVSWFMQTVANWFSPLAMQDAFCLVCWFSCSFVSEACARFGEWL